MAESNNELRLPDDSMFNLPVETRQRLLDAGEKLFSSNGFDRTSIRDITAEAGANTAAVNYYFSNKESLYIAVFHERLAEMREYRIAAMHDAIKTAGDSLTGEIICRTFAQAFLQPMSDSKSSRVLMRLFMREMTDPRLPAGMFFTEMASPMKKLLHEALILVYPELSEMQTFMCLHSIVGQLVHFLQVNHLMMMENGQNESLLNEKMMLDHVVKFTLAGINEYARTSAGENKMNRPTQEEDGV